MEEIRLQEVSGHHHTSKENIKVIPEKLRLELIAN
jgi:hypothetical protein